MSRKRDAKTRGLNRITAHAKRLFLLNSDESDENIEIKTPESPLKQKTVIKPKPATNPLIKPGASTSFEHPETPKSSKASDADDKKGKPIVIKKGKLT